MRVWPMLLLVGGCGLFGGGGGGGRGGRRGQGQATQTAGRGHLELVLSSRCPHPVDVCYGASEKCLTLADSAPRSLHASTGGTGEVLVTIKDSSTNIFADATFSMVEVDESCARLSRRLKPRD